MKKLIFYTACIIFTLPVLAQNEKQPFPFDEFTISANKTTVADANTSDRFGFGAGVYHTFLKQKKINLISGVEFNNTSQFKKLGTYSSKFASSYDITYHVYSVSIPFSARFNFGKKTKFFMEAGAYIDLNFGSNMKGRIVSARSEIDSTGHYYFVVHEGQLDTGADLKFLNAGASGGIGVSIPLNSKIDLILKSDYRFGIRNLIDTDAFFNRYLRLVVGLKWNRIL
jgi:hypothetical protein